MTEAILIFILSLMEATAKAVKENGGKEKDNPSIAYVGEITAVWVKK